MAERKIISSIFKLTDAIGITETQGDNDTAVESSVPDSLVPAIEDDSDHTNTITATSVSGGDPKNKKQILDELAKSEPSAYTAFASMMSELAEDVPEESRRAKIVFKSLKAQGIKLTDVLSAFEDKLASVDEYESAFKANVKSRTETDVSAHEKEAAKTEKLISDKETEIEQLREEINTLNDVRAKHLETAKSAIQKINIATKRVASELSSIRGSIRKEKDMVSDLTKEGK